MSKSHPAEAGALTFACNICGKVNTCRSDQIGREIASCSSCRSTVRMRSIVHTLSKELYGRCMPISEFPQSPRYKGIGTSDWDGYASRLAKRLDYTNTFYHKEPQVDITAPDASMNGTLDFVTSTDVFEHIVPPVSVAFEAVRRLLKPTGVFVFSVPYKLEGKTTEHYPDMHDWSIDRSGPAPVLRNQTKDGVEQVFENLVFHGGDGATLEMRVFSLESLQEHAKAAGFRPPRIYHSSHMQCGTVWEVDWSLTMALRPQ